MVQAQASQDDQASAEDLSRGVRFLLRLGPPGWVFHISGLLLTIPIVWLCSEPGSKLDLGSFLATLLLSALAVMCLLSAVLQLWAKRIRRKLGDPASAIRPRHKRRHWLGPVIVMAVLAMSIFGTPVWFRFMASRPALERHLSGGEPLSDEQSIGWFRFGGIVREQGRSRYVLDSKSVDWSDYPHVLTETFNFIHSPGGSPPTPPHFEHGSELVRCEFIPLGWDWYYGGFTYRRDHRLELQIQPAD